MEFTNAYISSLQDPFRLLGSIEKPERLVYDMSISKNNVYTHYFEMCIDEHAQEIEVPMYCKGVFEDTLLKNVISNTSFGKIAIPMYCNMEEENRRTADSIIKRFFSGVSLQKRLLKIKTNKGEVYYGGRGLVLDANFNPLLMCSAIGTKGNEEVRYKYEYNKIIIRVSPRVFLNSDGIIEKNIIKKIIPCYLSVPVRSIGCSLGFVDRISTNDVAQIVISDIDHYIKKVQTPSNVNINSELNALINMYKNEVINSL